MDPGNWDTDIEGGARFGYLHSSLVKSRAIAAVIVTLNLKLVFDILADWLVGRPLWVWAVILIPLGLVLAVLVSITAGRRWENAITTEAGMVSDAITPVHSGTSAWPFSTPPVAGCSSHRQWPKRAAIGRGSRCCT